VVLRFLETFWIRPSVHRQFSQGAGEAEDFRALASRKRTTSHTWGRVIALDALQIPRYHLRHDRSLHSRKLLTELQLLVCTLSGSANIDNNHIQQHESSNSMYRIATFASTFAPRCFFFHGGTSGSSKIAIPRTIVSSLSGTKYHENMAGSS
jgi:non-ribosomal peptide synthetase component E (peptide arylation enzyme)